MKLLLLAALRISIGLLFIYAGAIKIVDPAAFQKDIGNYQLLPFTLTAAVALYLPWLELFAGLAMVAKVYYEGALLLLFTLMAVFTAGLLSTFARGISISCGCLGKGSEPAGWFELARDLVLLSSIGFLIFVEVRCHLRGCTLPKQDPIST